ncbi:pyridoxamine 5'-phosphate oxidase family protein [Streptomyces lydicus]|uniref:pyridoxamine 5'-phosphate oxidase family protein n=1 Tax=Streptomyces lydicus TaxID=47763 RepID=UPI0005249A9E|nr:pyridoxamine 5'-phosphate oxidase family protein [Streptomyces lydicus]MDC7338041.1 pyridoxamine 5'-phosphate oxidase family protein [Streptomyces lydicus]UEG92540.1 pyridoxamine 5'-phosphate oxidase family protein [Streptomyces lydicus]
MPTDTYRAIELLGRIPYGRVSASRRALPFTTVTRHLVLDDGRLMLRLHRGYDYHRALDGSVVAYEADNVNSGAADTWSVQFTGTARVTAPAAAERERFGATPRLADGEPFDPVFLRIEPEFVTLHWLTEVPAHHLAHSA